jgi:hypothetical protein
MGVSLIHEPTFAQTHRNGVGGEPFTEVRFTAQYDGEDTQEHVIAIVTESECYMVSLDHPDRKWRGSDYFGPQLREWIARETCDDCYGIMTHQVWCEG